MTAARRRMRLDRLLHVDRGDHVLLIGPRSRAAAPLPASATGTAGSVTPFAGGIPFPFRDNRFDAALVEAPVGGPADAPRATHELYRVLAPGGRAILVSPVCAGPTFERPGLPTEGTLMALLEHCGFAAPKVVSRRRADWGAPPGSQTIVVHVRKPR